MSRRRAPLSRERDAWDERDELHRLDSVAGVVAAVSLAGCLASTALIATGRLVEIANYWLGAAALVLLICAMVAILSLNWSPLEALRASPDRGLVRVIERKRTRTKRALASLALCMVLGFVGTAFLEVAFSPNGDDGRGGDRAAHRPDGR